MTPDPRPLLDERAVEAAARALCRESLSLDLDKLKGEPRSAIYRETKAVLAAYFAALDREALVEHVCRAWWPNHWPRVPNPADERIRAREALAALGLFTPDTEQQR